MSEDIVKESIKCLANMEIKETTYQVARSVVLEEIERLHTIINEVREKVKGVKKINNEVYKQTDMLERFYSRKWCNDEMESFLEILDKGE